MGRMATSVRTGRFPLVEHARQLIRRRLEEALRPIEYPLDIAGLLPGKMLRTRLADCLLRFSTAAIDPRWVAQGCAATEMVHTASLCHDDVIDGGAIRRGRPALWRQAGAPAAVLIGDILLCEAMRLVAELDGRRLLPAFLEAIRQTCAAEVEHELLLRDRPIDEAVSLRLARGKTGALFGFAASLCGPDDQAAQAALREAGCCIGTAYQLADDLLDRLGGAGPCDKTLGTDAARSKATLAAADPAAAARHARSACRSALAALEAWPALRAGAAEFLDGILRPLWQGLGLPANILEPEDNGL